MVSDPEQEDLLYLEIENLKAKVKELENMLLDVLLQATGNREGTEIDTICLSAYEDACQYLAQKGHLKTVNGRIYKLVRK